MLGSQAGTPRAAFAEVQTAGRGRQGRRWWSAFGEQVQFSLAWHYQALPAPVPGLSLAVGVELAETLSRLGARGLQLKWPNDLLCKEGRKLAGILIELEGQVLGPCRVVVGVGVNHGRGAGGAEADRPVASLAEAGLEGVARNRLAAFLLSAVIRGCQRFGVTGLDDYREGWARWDALRDRPLSVVQAGATLRGWGAGISEDGALVLTLASGGQRVLHAGRCISVPHWLILDAGNSRLKFGLWDGRRVHATGAVSWSGDWPGELDVALAAMARPERVVVGSVHQTATVEALEAISRRRWECPLTRITTTAAACGVQNGYRDYRQLGVDRWAAVVAAHLRAPEAWHLVIDVGTAATVDVVGPRGITGAVPYFPDCGCWPTPSAAAPPGCRVWPARRSRCRPGRRRMPSAAAWCTAWLAPSGIWPPRCCRPRRCGPGAGSRAGTPGVCNRSCRRVRFGHRTWSWRAWRNSPGSRDDPSHGPRGGVDGGQPGPRGGHSFDGRPTAGDPGPSLSQSDGVTDEAPPLALFSEPPAAATCHYRLPMPSPGAAEAMADRLRELGLRAVGRAARVRSGLV